MALFSRIDHVQLALPAGGEAHARAFYVGIMGFEEVGKPQHLAGRGGLWLHSGTVKLHLGIDPDFRPARKAHPALRCTEYDTLLERLRENEVPIAPDVHRIDGARHCYVVDPFGNRLEVIEDQAA